MAVLCVNIDHVATIRQARGIREPDPVEAAVLCELNGAVGITVHLREDRRHIQDRDLEVLRQVVKGKLNLEMAATREMVGIALRVKPDMVTLVPERRQELTTEGGLDVAKNLESIRKATSALKKGGIEVSLFINPKSAQVRASKKTGAQFVELHTGRYCDAKAEATARRELANLTRAAREARKSGLRVNLGHGLNYRNVAPAAAIAGVEELNIGHSIVGRAVLVGMAKAVREMADIIARASATHQ